MRKNLIFTAILFSAALFSCTPEHSKIVVAEYDDSQILMPEFEHAYAKNAGGVQKAKDDSIEKMKNFLDLYVNFKMKLRDAWVRGYFDDPDINNEIDSYGKKVGSAYIKEKLIIEKGLKKLYDERKYEYRVSHILLRPNKAPGTKNVMEEAQSVLEQLKKGAAFETLCTDYSVDEYSKKHGGDVYWLTSGLISPEWDKAVTATPVGEVYPEPVKTKYGVHIIKVTDKRERTPEIKARHILITFRGKDGTVDSAKALKTAREVRQKLLDGADFAELAKEYSNDPGSASKGGDLGYFKRRKMVPQFDEAAFNLKVNEISDIVETRFGYHIIQVTDKKKIPPFEEAKNELREIYDRQRFKSEFAEYTDSLKKKFNYVKNETLVNFVAGLGDTTRLDSKIYEKPTYVMLKDSVVFTINGDPFRGDSLITFLVNDKEFRSRKLNVVVFTDGVKKYSSEVLLQYEALVLGDKAPGFTQLMEDYRYGIYIFKLQDSEIWSKIKIDSSDVRKYFEANRDNYTFPDRVEFYEIFTRQDSLINKYHQRILGGENFEDLAKKVTERVSKKQLAGHFELGSVSASVMAKKAWSLKNKGDISEPFKAGNGWSIVKLVAKDSARKKTYDEARAELLSDYQEYLSKKLEDEYINKLKERYNPRYYYDELGRAFKSESN